LVAARRIRREASSTLPGLVADRIVVPLVSTPLLLAHEDVLKRPEQLQAMAIGADWIGDFLAAFASSSESVEIHDRWRPQVRDPGDELALETAIDGRAAALVTFNLRDLADAGRGFGIPVMRPGNALKRCSV